MAPTDAAPRDPAAPPRGPAPPPAADSAAPAAARLADRCPAAPATAAASPDRPASPTSRRPLGCSPVAPGTSRSRRSAPALRSPRPSRRSLCWPQPPWPPCWPGPVRRGSPPSLPCCSSPESRPATCGCPRSIARPSGFATATRSPRAPTSSRPLNRAPSAPRPRFRSPTARCMALVCSPARLAGRRSLGRSKWATSWPSPGPCGPSGPARSPPRLARAARRSTTPHTCAGAASRPSSCSIARARPGVVAAAWPGVLDRMRGRAERAVAAGMSVDSAALLRGMVLGEDDRIDDATRQDWRDAGLAHLLAVSGQNVMLLSALALPLLALAGVGLRARFAVVTLLIAVYVPLAGAGPSLQRAGIMGLAGIVAMAASRPASRSYALVLAATATLAWNPRAWEDPGWQLSFAAVAGILAIGRAAGRGSAQGRERAGWRRASPTRLADGVALTVAATLATAPLVAHHFGSVPLAGLPANLLALPAVAPAMWLGMLKAALGQLAALSAPAPAPASAPRAAPAGRARPGPARGGDHRRRRHWRSGLRARRRGERPRRLPLRPRRALRRHARRQARHAAPVPGCRRRGLRRPRRRDPARARPRRQGRRRRSVARLALARPPARPPRRRPGRDARRARRRHGRAAGAARASRPPHGPLPRRRARATPPSSSTPTARRSSSTAALRRPA